MLSYNLPMINQDGIRLETLKYNRALLRNLVLISTFIWTLFFYFILGFKFEAFLTTSMFLTSIIVHYLYRFNLNKRIIDNFNIFYISFFIILIACHFSTGINFVSFFICTVVVATFLLLDLKDLIVWNIILILIIFFISRLGISSTARISIFESQWLFLATLINIVFLFSVVLYIHMRSRKKMMLFLLEQKENTLKFSNQATIGRVAGSLSDEITRPLEIIDERINQISKELPKDEGEKHGIFRSLETVHKTIQRIMNIIGTLEHLSKKDSAPEISVLKASAIFTKLKEEVKNLNSIGCDIRFVPNYVSESISLYGNEVALIQVLQNLIQNAIHAVDKREVRWVEIELKSNQRNICFTVTDSGNGIDPVVVEKLFSPFFTTKELGKGSGLGLALSYNFIKKMKGSIYYNKESKNTQFVVELRKA